MRRACVTLLTAWAVLGAVGCVNEYLHGEAVEEDSSGGGGTSDLGTGTTSSSSGAQSGSGDAESTSGGPAASTSSTGSSSTVATMEPSSGGDGSGGDGSGGDGSGGDGSGGDGGSGGAGPLELCEGPCDANAMCGTEADLCVELTEGNPVCLRACGRGCPDGYSCGMRQSVEGNSAEQCVPGDNMCP